MEETNKRIYKTYIELVTTDDVDEFTNICKTIKEDVKVKGLDENGCDWCLSAKS